MPDISFEWVRMVPFSILILSAFVAIVMSIFGMMYVLAIIGIDHIKKDEDDCNDWNER